MKWRSNPNSLSLSHSFRLIILTMELKGAKFLIPPAESKRSVPEDATRKVLDTLRVQESSAVESGLVFVQCVYCILLASASPVDLLIHRHLVSEQSLHAIEISVLCDFMDILCTLMVTANSCKRFGFLHEATLPRTWTRFCKHWGGPAIVSQKFSTTAVLDCIVEVFEYVMTMKNGKTLIFIYCLSLLC